MRRQTLLLSAVAMCAASLAALPASAKQPDQIVLPATADEAVVVMKAPYWQPALSMKSAYKLSLSKYDPVEGKLLGGPFSGVLIEAKQSNFVDGYIFATVKPGRWTFVSYSQQDLWALCFNAATVQFDVKPGEVIFLGDFDANSHRDQLTREAVTSGKTSIRGYGFYDFFDLPAGPRLAPVDEPQLAAVRAMLSRYAPRITAPVRAAEYTPAQFGTGSTLFAERRCGGYFAVGAKKAQ